MTLTTLMDQLTEAAARATSGEWNIQLVGKEETCWLDGENGNLPPTIHDLNYIDLACPANIMRLVSALRETREAMRESVARSDDYGDSFCSRPIRDVLKRMDEV